MLFDSHLINIEKEATIEWIDLIEPKYEHVSSNNSFHSRPILIYILLTEFSLI